jgi:hypothetical protein
MIVDKRQCGRAAGAAILFIQFRKSYLTQATLTGNVDQLNRD